MSNIAFLGTGLLGGAFAEAVRNALRIHIVLKDDDVVEEVLAAAHAGLSPDAIIIDHTTTLPIRTAARAERLNAEGVKYLHCPVFMGPPAARNAQGTMMAAGPKALFEMVKADLAKMTGRLEYFGERADLAAVGGGPHGSAHHGRARRRRFQRARHRCGAATVAVTGISNPREFASRLGGWQGTAS